MLSQIRNGNWIILTTVKKITVTAYPASKFTVTIILQNGDAEFVNFDTQGDADKYSDALASEVNKLEAEMNIESDCRAASESA